MFFSAITGIIILYLGICAFMWAMQRSLMYHPYIALDGPASYGLDFEDIRFQAADGVALRAWYRAPHPGYPLLVYFHGNAGNLANRAHVYQTLAGAGYGVFALSYRGYGGSGGVPGEAGFYADGRAAIAYARDELNIPVSQMVAYGESIGTGVATQMAGEFDLAALVLWAPFTSLENRAAEIYPWLPVRLLLKDRFDSIGKIGSLRMPVLIMHGEQDNIIPPEHGKALLAAAPEPKQGEFFSGIGHNDFPAEYIMPVLNDFFRKHRLTGLASPLSSPM